MRRRILIALSAFILTAAAATMLAPTPASAGNSGVKFFVVEWKLVWDMDTIPITNDDGTTRVPLTLRIKGRASLDGRDFDKDFELEVSDAEPYLQILQTCGMGRMSGAVDRYNTENAKVIGTKLSELSCRAILK